MTVKEFYDLAVKSGYKNAEIYVNFEYSDDDYYNPQAKITKENVVFLQRDSKRALVIDIS